MRLCEGRFNVSCVSTLGLDFSTKLLMVEDETVVFQLWDTAGQEKLDLKNNRYFFTLFTCDMNVFQIS